MSTRDLGGRPRAVLTGANILGAAAGAGTPALDRRLKAHYGDEFDRRAAKTSRYIPLVG